MTRTFAGMVACPACGTVHTAETAFERWMRNDPDLDSRRIGVVRFDCDVLLHRYMIHVDGKSSRDVQCLMFVEVKTHGADLSLAQRDTLSLFSQVLRNRRATKYVARRGRHAEDHTPLAKVYSHVLRRPVTLRMFGGHLLQLAGEDPVTSAWIRWDKRAITRDQLVQVLRFELDPDTLCPLDWRRRSHPFGATPWLWTPGEAGT